MSWLQGPPTLKMRTPKASDAFVSGLTDEADASAAPAGSAGQASLLSHAAYLRLEHVPQREEHVCAEIQQQINTDILPSVHPTACSSETAGTRDGGCRRLWPVQYVLVFHWILHLKTHKRMEYVSITCKGAALHRCQEVGLVFGGVPPTKQLRPPRQLAPAQAQLSTPIT